MRLTYGDLSSRSRSLAGRLRADGLARDDLVLVDLPNGPAAVVVALAIQMAGGVPFELSHSSTASQLSTLAERYGIRFAFLTRGQAARLRSELAAIPMDRVWTLEAGPPPGDGAADAEATIDPAGVMRGSAAGPPIGVALQPHETGLILQTSGTTAVPHAVRQTHANIAANTASIAEYLRLEPGDRALLALPLAYCYGRSVLQTHLFVGGSVHFADGFTFPAVAMQALATEGCTGFAGVPLTFELLRRQVDVAGMSMPTLRYVTQAGGRMAEATLEWARDAFAPADVVVMYGQTEATARLTYLPPARAREKRGSIGVPIPGVTIAVVDEAAREQPPETVGHLVARGPNVTPGYLDDPVATAEILHDGWLWTGDLAHRDPDGFLYLDGRAREIIKRGGHRVGIAEIEGAISAHPAVESVGVVGMPDDVLGEVPVAFVQLRPGTTAGAAQLLDHSRQTLPAVSVPTDIVIVESLPIGPNGKVRRPELAAQYRVIQAGRSPSEMDRAVAVAARQMERPQVPGDGSERGNELG